MTFDDIGGFVFPIEGERKETVFDLVSPISKEERQTWTHQLKVLRDDIGLKDWEKAHLSLFIVMAYEKRQGRWGRCLQRANIAYKKGEMERFERILGEMEDMINEKIARGVKDV